MNRYDFFSPLVHAYFIADFNLPYTMNKWKNVADLLFFQYVT